MKIVFLLTHIPDPRINKRIQAIKDSTEVAVICTRRKSQDIYQPVHTDIEHNIFDIDLPSSKHIIRRTFLSHKYKVSALKELNRIKPDIIYADGFDSLLIAKKYKKYKKMKLIYEVADLREDFIQKPSNVMRRLVVDLLAIIEKDALKKLDYLVLTSMMFYEKHYKNLFAKEKIIYAPNIPEKKIFEGYKKKKSGQFTIGFIGGIRYLNQMKMLVDAAEITGCQVIFAGAGGTTSDYEKIRDYCIGKQNVKFTGRYDYNLQIAQLYGMVNCVYAVYDASNPNVKIALPNKLYESVYCELPIVVAKDTYLSKIVEKNGIGKSVRYDSLDELVQVINELKESHMFANHIDWSEAKKNLLESSWERDLLKIVGEK